MNFGQSFFRSMSICSLLAGLLGFTAWLLSFAYAPPHTLEEEITLHSNLFFSCRLLLLLAMLFLVEITFLGVAAKKIKTVPGLATTGFIISLIHFMVETPLAVIEIFTLNHNWFPRLAVETNEATRDALINNINTFKDISGAFIIIILITLLAGTLLYGIATWKGKIAEKVVSYFFFISFISLAVWAIGYYGQLQWLSSCAQTVIITSWFILFFLIAIWLWREAEETNG